jgi:hypothetical protein
VAESILGAFTTGEMIVYTMRKRLDRLERLQVEFAHQEMVRRRDCRGLDLEEILARLESAMPEEYEAPDAGVGEQLTQWQEKGGDLENVPGFLIWVCGLQEGWLHLPETIPISVLRSFVDLHPENSPLQRCEDCWLGLPANCTSIWQSCPACGSQRIYWADFNKPWGTYRPQAELVKHLKRCKPSPCYITDEVITYLGERHQTGRETFHDTQKPVEKTGGSCRQGTMSGLP